MKVRNSFVSNSSNSSFVCNRRLGCFDDNIELFKQTIKYLED